MTGSESQTREILESFESELEAAGLNISENCVRTWFYVDDIDSNYSGVVVARRENFETLGMTKLTHYLASTGIGGQSVEEGSVVQMDALSLKGDFSQHYLYAPDNFNPTHEAGVTMDDMKMMVIYLRNPEDYETVSKIFRTRFGSGIPYVITHAPVCRPGWLIEMECIA